MTEWSINDQNRNNTGFIRILDIIKGTTVDGPGLRTSLYMAGCLHNCPECHNPESHDFNSGELYSLQEIKDIILEEDFDVTFSGGDPLYHPEAVRIISEYTHSIGHTVWVYTGFIWEDIINNPKILPVLEYIDVLIDGPYVKALRNADLLFRGSSNQRIIDVREALKSNELILWTRNNDK